MTASVVSAAILEGNLIIGLSDGSVINCGYVQGPQGLKGDPGPMGSDGDAGRDGNTIITVAGTPRNDAGTDGDYAIDNVNWRIYGPKAGGVWGKANDMLPSKENLIVNGRGFEGGAGGSGDSGGGGGGEGIRLITGGDGIKTDAQSSTVTEVEVDLDASRGLAFYAKKLGINIGDGLEFDATTGALKADLDDYATKIELQNETDARVAGDEANLVLINNNKDAIDANKDDIDDNKGDITNNKNDIDDIRATYATKAYSDSKDANLQNQINDLSVSKGKVARYEVKNVTGTPVTRPGEMSTNNAFWPNVVFVSFGVEDLSGDVTKPIATGDIIDFGNAATGKISRYKVTDSTGAPTGVAVEYISGDSDFAIGEERQVYIYPQNEAGASKEYVDAQDALKLDIAGGTVTGPLIIDSTLTINDDSTYNGTSNDEESLINRKYVDDKLNDILPKWIWNRAEQPGSNYDVSNIFWTYIDTDTIKLNVSTVPMNRPAWRYPGKAHTAVSFPINIQAMNASGKLVPILCGTTSSIRALDFNGSSYWQVYVPIGNQFIWNPTAVPNLSRIAISIPGYFS